MMDERVFVFAGICVPGFARGGCGEKLRNLPRWFSRLRGLMSIRRWKGDF